MTRLLIISLSFLFLGFESARAHSSEQAADEEAHRFFEQIADAAVVQSPTLDGAHGIPLVIYQTNDIHGELGRGAFLASVLEAERLPYLFLDSGDWFQGSPEGNLTKGEAVIDLLNQLKVDAAALGNHDYDYGEENVRRLARLAQFPLLGSNIKRGDAIVDYVKPYVILTRNGVRVGVFGLNTAKMSDLVPAENIEGLTFEREIDAAKRTVAQLRAEGAEVIVAATHMGIEEYKGTPYQGIGEGDLALADQVAGIDLILGGHLHISFQEPVKRGNTCITQTGGYLKSVFRVVLQVNAKTRRVEGCDGAPIALSSSTWTASPAIELTAQKYRQLVDKEMSVPLGSSFAALTQDATTVSPMGAWFSDVLWRWGGTEIAFVNTFGIRNGLPQGQLTYGDLYKVMPFDNRAVKIEIRGAQLREMIERALSDGAIWIQYSGMELEYSASAPYGSRVRRVTIGGAPLDDAKVYSATTHDFVAKVDKVMKGLDKTITVDNGPLVRDLLIDEVKRASPIAAPTEIRLIRQP